MKIDENFIEMLGTLFFKLDTRGVFLDLTNDCLSIFGYAKEEMIGKNFKNYISGKDQKKYILFFDDTIKNNKRQYRQELEIVVPNGENKILGFNLFPIEDEQNNVVGLFGFGTDITERKKMENNLAEEKEKIREQSAALEKANKELGSFSKDLEGKVAERTAQLTTLYEVSESISYTLDYQTLIKLIMESLLKIVDHDICASLLFDVSTANVTIKPVYFESERFIDEVKGSIIVSVLKLTGEDISGKNLNIFLIPSIVDVKSKAVPDGTRNERRFDELRSSLNVPFIVRGKPAGILNISSCKDNAFTENDVKLINTIANLASNAIERLQAAISVEKSKMDSMVKSMSEGVVMVDERGEVVVINTRARQFLGFSFDEQITAKAWKKRITDLGLNINENNKPFGSRELALNLEGENIFLYCEMTRVKNEQGEDIGVVTILRDITELKRTDNMKTEFISIVSHELRTPLAITKEGIELIIDEIPGKINETQSEILNTSKDSIDRLARIINDLLDISKIEAGKAVFRKDRVELKSLIEKVAVSFDHKLKEKNLELRLNLPEEKLEVYGDWDKIIQVFMNLISNAVKFTKKGYLKISAEEKDAMIECSVADTGIGIAAENLPRVFKRFEQFERVDGEGEKGTGLGLSIIKGIIEAHNGKVWVESEYGKGTKFIFALPKYTAEILFKMNIGDAIKKAEKDNIDLGLIFISIKDIDKLMKILTPEKFASILKDMETVTKTTMRQAGEVIIKGEKELIILINCKREVAQRIIERLKQALEEQFCLKYKNEKISLSFGCASYPDDGKSVPELVQKAKESGCS